MTNRPNGESAPGNTFRGPGGRGGFGPEETCDMAAPMAAFSRLMRPPPPGMQGPFALSQDGALQGLVHSAGLEPIAVEGVDVPFDLADDAAALHCPLSNGPPIIVVRTSGAERVRQAVLESIRPYRFPSGAYRLNNKFRYLIAR